MVSKKDILEIKRRFKKEGCTISRIGGCYVDASREKVTSFNETFLNLEEEEFFKYLDIAKKLFSGTLGNNLLELPFNLAEVGEADSENTVKTSMQQYFMGLRESELKNDELLQRLYDRIIDNYDYAGNYLILAYYDVYDIPLKTSDDLKLDESEEMFPYILVAVCPVNLTKPGLGYLKDDNKIGLRIRDWVVDMPDMGFMFPSFADRSADVGSITFYLKDPKDSRRGFVETALGTMSKRTVTDQRLTFHAIIKSAIAPVIAEQDEKLIEIQESLKEMVSESVDGDGQEVFDETAVLTAEIIEKALTDNAIPESVCAEIKKTFKEVFEDEDQEVPSVLSVIDEKKIAAVEKEKHEEELLKNQVKLTAQVEELSQELVEKNFNEVLNSEEPTGLSQTYDVILRVKPERAGEVRSEEIDGKRCIVIPLEEGEYVNLNGIKTQL